MAKYTIVSGLRRSGTSLLMYALKQAGIPIIGFKFSTDPGKDHKKSEQGNPNGYWELKEVSVDKGLFLDLDRIDGLMKGEVVKVMFEALPKSKPELIDKTIVIFRKPKKILYSLGTANKARFKETFLIKCLLDTVDTLGWLMYNEIDYKIVFYEDILENPEKEMKEICEYLGKGDYKKAAKSVDQKLNRSVDTKNDYRHIKAMEDVYNWAKQGQIMKIIGLEEYLVNEAKKLQLLKKD